MTKRTHADDRQGTIMGLPVFVVALGAVAVLVGLGIVLAAALGSDDDGGSTPAVSDVAFGPIAVEGAVLPDYDGTDPDVARGLTGPTIEGIDFAAEPSTVGPTGQPTMIAFLAHWCPHCQRELPRLVSAAGDGVFDGIRMVAVLTGTNQEAPNYPPSAWLEREGWTGDVVVDDDRTTAANAYGLAGYPFIVWLDSDFSVVARTSGELEPEDLVALAGLIDG